MFFQSISEIAQEWSFPASRGPSEEWSMHQFFCFTQKFKG